MQTNLPHYREPWFLERAVQRHRRFLALHRAHPTHFLVPAFDMDLVWHTHMVKSPPPLPPNIFRQHAWGSGI